MPGTVLGSEDSWEGQKRYLILQECMSSWDETDIRQTSKVTTRQMATRVRRKVWQGLRGWEGYFTRLAGEGFAGWGLGRRPTGHRQGDDTTTWEEDVPGGGHSQCKGPEVGACVGCSENCRGRCGESRVNGENGRMGVSKATGAQNHVLVAALASAPSARGVIAGF